MILGLSISELLIISLFFITAINCALTYYCCVKSLKIFEEEKARAKAVNKLRIFDQYILSKINLVVSLFYFGVSYLFIDAVVESSNYIFFFVCLLSLILTIITTFVSRLSYCYTCNVLLNTKLNEIDCFMVNFKRLITIYLPFIAISFAVSTIYMIELELIVKNIISVIGIVLILFAWVMFTPKIMMINNNAKKIEDNSLLKYRLEKLFEAHNVEKYELYYWDTSRSKESNAMVSGLKKYYLFVSSNLIEEVTLPELETVVTHEIGHIKNHHLIKMMIGKVFVVTSIIVMIFIPYFLKFNEFNRLMFYILTFFVGSLEIFAAIAVERRYEIQADEYVALHNDSNLFESALKKISKYEDDTSKVDQLFQSHPSVKKRIKVVDKKNNEN